MTNAVNHQHANQTLITPSALGKHLKTNNIKITTMFSGHSPSYVDFVAYTTSPDLLIWCCENNLS